MNKLTDALLVLAAAIFWLIAVMALVRSDGNCSGVCDGCVYSGNCPQERRDE